MKDGKPLGFNPIVRRMAKDYSTETRQEFAEKGWALPDGSFPIADCEDVKDAIHRAHQAKDPEKARAHIKKRWKELGCEGPEPFSSDKESRLGSRKKHAYLLYFSYETAVDRARELSVERDDYDAWAVVELTYEDDPEYVEYVVVPDSHIASFIERYGGTVKFVTEKRSRKRGRRTSGIDWSLVKKIASEPCVPCRKKARRSELLTEDLRKQIPPLYSQENNEDPIVWARFFHPSSGWEWYPIEFDGEDTFFGFVRGWADELGYFTLSELEENGVERDLYWTPRPLSQVKSERRTRRVFRGTRSARTKRGGTLQEFTVAVLGDDVEWDATYVVVAPSASRAARLALDEQNASWDADPLYRLDRRPRWRVYVSPGRPTSETEAGVYDFKPVPPDDMTGWQRYAGAREVENPASATGPYRDVGYKADRPDVSDDNDVSPAQDVRPYSGPTTGNPAQGSVRKRSLTNDPRLIFKTQAEAEKQAIELATETGYVWMVVRLEVTDLDDEGNFSTSYLYEVVDEDEYVDGVVVFEADPEEFDAESYTPNVQEGEG